MRFSCVISAFSLTASAWQDDATSLLQAQVQKNMDREGCLSEKCKPSPKTITTTAEVVTTLAPVVTTPAPVVTTPAPVVTTPAPVVKTPAPVVSTPAPLVNTPPPVSEPRCTAGDPDAICTQLRDGQQWDNDDLLSMYSCLATNCVDQTGLWDGVTCEHALESLSCSDAADLSGHDPSQQLTKFTGTVADACPRSCKAECAKCPAPVVNTPAPVVTTPAPLVRLPPDQLDEVPDGCKGFKNVQEDCTNKDLFILKKNTNGFVKPTFKPDQYGSDEIWETVKVQDSEWKGTCIAYVNTRGGTCKTFCESNGMKCVRAMDDAHMQTAGLSKWLKTGGYNPTDCTLLPSGHTRQSQTENGCNQRWGTQMCACN